MVNDKMFNLLIKKLSGIQIGNPISQRDTLIQKGV